MNRSISPGCETRKAILNILFLCTGNSCRSIMAEAVFNHLAPRGLAAVSAGSRPRGFVHPWALRVLEEEGIRTSGLWSKSWESLPQPADLVVTLCDSAAGEECPLYLSHAPRVHWGLKDPDAVEGSEEVRMDAFRRAYTIIRARIEHFLTLPDIVSGTGNLPACSLLEMIGQIGEGTEGLGMRKTDF